jgi:hypothetical protein
MDVIDVEELKKISEGDSSVVTDKIREEILQYSKSFKRSWIQLGRHLYAVYQDKMYESWGFKKFEDYTSEEIGIQKTTCLKLLKNYLFIEQDEPAYLDKAFGEDRDAVNVPGYDLIDVLRLAKQKKELLADDYRKLKTDVFDKGKEASEVRQELTAIMKERKPVDPEEERDLRNEAAIKKLINSILAFQKDMTVLKLLPDDISEEALRLKKRLEEVL